MKKGNKYKKSIIIISLLISIALLNTKTFAVEKENELTEKQKAIVEIANSFLYRGEALQYGNENLFRKQTASGSMMYGNIRFSRNLYPEEATVQDKKYTVCSGLTYSTYEDALGIKLPELTYDLIKEAEENRNNKEYVPIYEETSEKSDLQEFVNNLQVGDLIVTRNRENNGHTMIYIGNNKIIHSSGGIYNFETGKDSKEDNGTVRIDDIYATLLKPGNNRYIKFYTEQYGFYYTKYAILRPLASEEGKSAELTQYAKNKLKYKGLVIENISSIPTKQSVKQGDTIKYTIKITNNGNTTYNNLPVNVQIPQYTTYKQNSADNNAKFDNNSIAWNIKEVKPNQTIFLNYEVQVQTGENLINKTIESKAIVGGIQTNIITNIINNTLNENESNALLKTAYKYYLQSQKGNVQYISGFNNFENENLAPENADSNNIIKFNTSGLVNGIYKNTFGIDLNLRSTSEIIDNIFEEATYKNEKVFVLKDNNGTNSARNMAVPELLGGTLVRVNSDEKRASSLATNYLQIGDVIVSRYDNNGQETGEMYLYLGENTLMSMSTTKGVVFLNATTNLDKLLSYKKVIVLRPAFNMNNQKITKEAEERVNNFKEEEKEQIDSVLKGYKLKDMSFANRINMIINRFTLNDNLEYDLNADYEKIPEETKKLNEAGFIYSIYYNSFGIKLPKTIDELLDEKEMKVENLSATTINLNNLRRGDIIVYEYINEKGEKAQVANIYIGISQMLRFSKENGLEIFQYSTEKTALNELGESIKKFAVIRPMQKYDLVDYIENWEEYDNGNKQQDANNATNNTDLEENQKNVIDNTVSDKILPKAGKTGLTIGLIILSIFIINYILYKKIKINMKN